MSSNNIFHNGFGCTFQLGSFNNLPPFIKSNLFPSFASITKESLHIIFRIEGPDNIWVSSTETHENIIKAYLIETGTSIQLPKSHQVIHDRCGLLVLPEIGIITLGGDSREVGGECNNVQVLEYDEEEDRLKWNDNDIIPAMWSKRSNIAPISIDNDKKIFVSSGFKGGNTAEIYDIENREWTLIAELING